MINEREIKEYADMLCRKYSGVHITQIRDRNEKIVQELMIKFKIDYAYAKRCFEENKVR